MSENNPNSIHDNAIAYFFISLVLIGVIWLFWHFNQEIIRNMVRWIRYGEMWLIKDIVPDNFSVLFAGRDFNWHEGFNTAAEWQSEQLTRQHLSFFNALAMGVYKYLFAVICGFCAIWAYTKGPRTKNRKNLGLQGLIEYQSQNFPTITPFVRFNPSKQPPRPPGSPVPAELPAFAEALGPEEWVAYNSIQAPDGKIDETSAAKAFQKQLIGRWKGARHLKPYQQILLAAFCLKASRKRKECDVLLGRVACCWSHDKGLDLKRDKKLLGEARSILKNKKLAAKTLEQANRHAFITTALLRALQFAREEGGVLAPAQFVWLRGYNRALWYPLNNLGRQSLHTEAIGAMAHFKAERLTQRPVPSPKVEGAVETLSEYMSSMKARPIPVLNYSDSKKKAIKKAV